MDHPQKMRHRIRFLPIRFLPTRFLPTCFLPTRFLPTRFLPTSFLPTRFRPTRFLPTSFLPTRFLPTLLHILLFTQPDFLSTNRSAKNSTRFMNHKKYRTLFFTAHPGPAKLLSFKISYTKYMAETNTESRQM